LPQQIQQKKGCAQEEATGMTLFASLFQTGHAREFYSNCNSKATELVNNGSNINGKFTAIKNTLTSREALSSQDNTVLLLNYGH